MNAALSIASRVERKEIKIISNVSAEPPHFKWLIVGDYDLCYYMIWYPKECMIQHLTFSYSWISPREAVQAADK